VRPTPHTENLGDLRAELSSLFYSREISRPAALQHLSRWADSPILYDVDALAHTLRFMVRRYALSRGILGVDIGGNGSRTLLVHGEGPALTWAAPYGTGAGLAALRELGNPMAVVRWMCHPLSWAEVWDRLSNIELRPTGIPQSDEDWDLQQASAREALNRAWLAAWQAWGYAEGEALGASAADMIVARGTVLSHARTPAEAALVVIDALQPSGLQRLALDWANTLPGLTGLAQLDALAAVQTFDSDSLLELGTLVAPRFTAGIGSRTLRARLFVNDELRGELAVPAGSIRRLPLGANESGRLELRLPRGTDLGLGKRGRNMVVQVRGGALGVIIDMRGRPLALPVDEAERCQTLEAWRHGIEEA
jgi:hypothetical protein